jgi:hypothetical protein
MSFAECNPMLNSKRIFLFAPRIAAMGLALSACTASNSENPDGDDDDDQSGQTNETDAADDDDDDTPSDSCIDNEEYFRDTLWTSVLSQKCQACHNPSGDARDSDLVLVGSWWGPGYTTENYNTVALLAQTEINGISVLLRKPSMNEVSHMGGLQAAQDSADYAKLEEFVERIKNPGDHQCPDDDEGEFDAAFAKITQASPAATLRKALLMLNGRLPTQAELDQVAADDIASIDPLLDQAMEEEAFYARLEEIFNDYFLTDRYLPYNSALDLLDRDDYPNAYWFEALEEGPPRDNARRYTNEAIARDALHLVSHVVREHRPFSEILTANYTLVNPFAAKAYGISPSFADPENPNEWVEVQLPGIPHFGVLTSYMMMNRMPTTPTNRNRHRARKIYQFFLATDLLSLASRPIDPTKITDHNPTLNNPSCLICHSNMDPVAGTLQNWDERGRYRPPADGWYPDLAPPGFGNTVMPAAQKADGTRWLSEQIIADRRFPMSIVHLVFQALLGQKPLSEPTDSTSTNFGAKMDAFRLQEQLLNHAAQKFVESNFELRVIVKELVKSPYFRAAGSTDLSAYEQIVFADLGTARFLTPEMLSRKIQAVVGYPWKRRGQDDDLLLNQYWYRIFYGGIDSDSITERITSPNGIMNNVALRMSNEVACWTTARDFALDKNSRILFPYVESTVEPEDANEFEIPGAVADIKQNLVHLYKRVLGEDHAVDSPEIARAFAFFLDVWKTGKREIAATTQPTHLPWECQALNDYWTDTAWPEDQRIAQDPNYTIRAWMAVMSFLLSDYRFLHE